MQTRCGYCVFVLANVVWWEPVIGEMKHPLGSVHHSLLGTSNFHLPD